MAAKGQADDSRPEANRPVLRSWPGYEGLNDVTSRLRRSATITLLLSPVGLVFISVSRLLIISNYNPVTASAVASSSGYIDTLLGTVIPLVPIFLPYLALLLLFFGRVVPGILALLAVIFVSPMTVSGSAALSLIRLDWRLVIHAHTILIMIMLLLAALLVGLLLGELFGLGYTIFIKSVATIVCILLVPLILQLYSFPFSNNFNSYAQIIRAPWLPTEMITLTSGREFTGYVLSGDGNWLVVLKEASRRIHYYPVSEVARRQICRLGQTQLTNPPLIMLSPASRSPTSAMLICEISSVGPAGQQPIHGHSGPLIFEDRHQPQPPPGKAAGQ